MTQPLLYQINTRCWLRELSGRLNRSVSLGQVPENEFAEWQECGFTHIWLMGVWGGGPLAREKALQSRDLRQAYSEALPDWVEADVAASPYAILEYQVPSTLGGEKGLEQFRRQLNARGMKLILDFVPNHFGLDTPLLKTHPEYFVQAKSGDPWAFSQATTNGSVWLAHGKDPYFPAWGDTVQLDYRKVATRHLMLQILGEISSRCDGVRCDMAMLVLNDVFARTWQNSPTTEPAPGVEFWETAIAAVKKAYPDFLFLAEAYWGLEQRLRDLGFDYTYDKTLYDLLVSHQAERVQSYLLEMGEGSIAAGAHFLENHDEPRIAALMSGPEHRAAATIILGLPGLRFLHEGQLVGARLRLPVQLVRRTLEPVNSEIQNSYTQLLSALKTSLVGQGRAKVLSPREAWSGNPTGRNFVIIQWRTDGPRFDLVVVNLAPHRSQCFAPVDLLNHSTAQWSVQDSLSSENYVRSGGDLQSRGFYLDVAAFGTHIFRFQPG